MVENQINLIGFQNVFEIHIVFETRHVFEIKLKILALHLVHARLS